MQPLCGNTCHNLPSRKLFVLVDRLGLDLLDRAVILCGGLCLGAELLVDELFCLVGGVFAGVKCLVGNVLGLLFELVGVNFLDLLLGEVDSLVGNSFGLLFQLFGVNVSELLFEFFLDLVGFFFEIRRNRISSPTSSMMPYLPLQTAPGLNR